LPDTQAYPIQNVIAPDFGRPENLYFNTADTAPACRGALPWTMLANHKLSTNTYLNALFPHVWQTYANIGQIGLHVNADAKVSISVYANFPDCDPLEIVQWTGAGPHVLWLKKLPTGTVRLTFTLFAKAAVNITGLQWVTDTAPRRAASLSIGLCTFNREPFLALTLNALVQQRETTPAIEAIWVVNQGAAFRDTALLENANLDSVNVLEQPNLGGCGGFTRSLLESITSENPTTHHVLMDDDIVLDPRVIDRIALFLGYCDENLALGGQMLEIEHPTRLHEAGGRLHPLWYVESVGHGLEMDQPKGIALFDETPEIHYNAWWFCVIPTDVIRTIGLPPPLFIRGDDIEYGCRMKEAGVATIPLPGCVVWHESFAYKTSDWLHYYDLRNRLILAGLHPNTVAPPDALYLLGYCLSILFQHRYRATEVALKAISDVLTPPKEALGVDSATRHNDLVAWLKHFPEPKNYAVGALPENEAGVLVPLDPSVPAMVKMSVKGFITLHLSRIMPRRKPLKFDCIPQAPAVGSRDYLAARNPEGSEFTLYRSDLRLLWRLFFKTTLVCLKYARQSKEMGGVYRVELEEMRSKENWLKTFGKSP